MLVSLPGSQSLERVDFLKHHVLETGSHGFVQDFPANQLDKVAELDLRKGIPGLPKRGNLIAKDQMGHWPHRCGRYTSHVIKKLSGDRSRLGRTLRFGRLLGAGN